MSATDFPLRSVRLVSALSMKRMGALTVSAGAKTHGAGVFCVPYGYFQFVEGAGIAAAEVVAGHFEDVRFDVLLAGWLPMLVMFGLLLWKE